MTEPTPAEMSTEDQLRQQLEEAQKIIASLHRQYAQLAADQAMETAMREARA